MWIRMHSQKGVSLLKDNYKQNYKSKFGITLKAAKEIVKSRNGRLPRPGWETLVKRDVVGGKAEELYLSNSAGSFYLWKWYSL